MEAPKFILHFYRVIIVSGSVLSIMAVDVFPIRVSTLLFQDVFPHQFV